MESGVTTGKLAPKERIKTIYLRETHLGRRIVTTSTDQKTNKRNGKKESVVLNHKRLKEDTVPCIWPGAPLHLSQIASPRLTTLSPSESRRENFARLQEETELENISQSTFNCLKEFQEKEERLSIPSVVTKIQTSEYILL